MRKKGLTLLLSLCVAASGISAVPCGTVNAQELPEMVNLQELPETVQEEAVGAEGEGDILSESEEYWYHDLGNGTIELTSYNYTGSEDGIEVEIPAVLDGKKVVRIGNGTFEPTGTVSNITKITIPEGVTSIGITAFRDCRKLTEINIPETVTVIEKEAFWGSYSLTEMVIPKSVESIGEWAFLGCSSLTNIEVDAANTKYASLDGNLYNKNKDTLLSYAPGKEGNFSVPDGVKTIAEYAFYQCSKLTGITIGKGVTSIGHAAFSGCDGLTELIIPGNVKSIGDSAFFGSSNIESIIMEEGVNQIGTDTFSLCFELKSVTIPASVTSIGEYPFNFCNKLTGINVAAGSSAYLSIDGVLYNKAKTILVRCPGGKTGEIAVPASVKEIASEAFAGCRENVTIVCKEGSAAYEYALENDIACRMIPLARYTVKFDKNGGSKVSKSSVTVKEGQKIGTLPTARRKGYTLKGWYTAKSGGKKVTASTKITKNQTLYAQWTKVTKPKKVGKLTLKSTKSGQLTVSYSKVKDAKGYEICYATNKKFKGAKKVTTTAAKQTIKKLKKKTTYYVRVHAYKLDSAGKKVWGDYSAVKSLKIK